MALAVTLSASAEGFDKSKFKSYDLPTSKLHIYQSGDPMGDVSFIVEGEKRLVVVEQPTFYAAIEEFKAYVESLKKPIEKVVASYHSGGLAQYPSKLVTIPETMISFAESPAAKGMIAKFSKIFGESADFRPFKNVKGFALPSTQQWAGVEFLMTKGAASDMPAASIQIDGDAFYTHFSPAWSHAKTMQVKSVEAIDAMISEMEKISNSGAKYIFGSHGKPSTQAAVKFQIGYLKRMKSLRSSCERSDQFIQKMVVSFPKLDGAENLRGIAKNLYPDEELNPAQEEVRVRMQDYLDVVSNLDMKLAKSLWAEGDDISIIAPRGHFFGFNEITQNFLLKNFSSMKSRKLSSLSEVINIYGTSANVQLYWKFDTVDANGVAHSGRGRETLLFEKIDGVWRLVHVHYSRMPE